MPQIVILLKESISHRIKTLKNNKSGIELLLFGADLEHGRLQSLGGLFERCNFR
jgi:hypothetical protein